MESVTRQRLWIVLPLSVAALGLFVWVCRGPLGGFRSEPASTPPTATIALVEPHGFHTEPPTAFRWSRVEGAGSYRLTIADRDTIWPLAVREVETTEFYFTNAERRAWSVPRSYEWTVEALSESSESVIATGVSYFGVGPFLIPSAEEPANQKAQENQKEQESPKPPAHASVPAGS